MERDFLGRGWSFPVDTDRDGAISLRSGETDIEESIRIILGTAKGERVMRPEFGCGIHEYTFATVNTTTLNLIEETVLESLQRFEPRIEVLSVDCSTANLDGGRLDIDVAYRIRQTNDERNLVYPFYLEESRR